MAGTYRIGLWCLVASCAAVRAFAFLTPMAQNRGLRSTHPSFPPPRWTIPWGRTPRGRLGGVRMGGCCDGEGGCDWEGGRAGGVEVQEKGRRSLLSRGVQLLGALLAGSPFGEWLGGGGGPAWGEEGPPPQVTSRNRKGASPFGYREVQERLVTSVLKQDPGGLLFREAMFKSDTRFPDWMAGEWLVRATIDEVNLPLGKKYKPIEPTLCSGKFQLWSPFGPCFLPATVQEEEGREVYYRCKWDKDLRGVHRDHPFNFVQLVGAYGDGYTPQEVEYDYAIKTLTARISSPGSGRDESDASVALRKIRGFGTERCSTCSTFVCWDMYDSIVRSDDTGERTTRRFEIVASYHIVESTPKDDEGEYGDTIEALQRVALYLGPSDEWYEETKGFAVALIDIKLVLRRVLQSETFA